MLTNDNRNKNGRGYTRHYYKVEDVARVSGRAMGTIRNASWSGKLDLDDLESVVGYCQRCKGKRLKTLP